MHHYDKKGSIVTAPKRIQRKRAAGWRMPCGAKSCTRPGKWGNPFEIETYGSVESCLRLFENYLRIKISGEPGFLEPLRGYDLACFCAPDAQCHVDVILRNLYPIKRHKLPPLRPALRYFGGKWRDAKKIIAQFPVHDCYCEPFGGGASVLLQKPPAFTEFYNDIGSGVTNFFRVLRENEKKLIGLIENTPYSREEFALAQGECDDPIEAARRFFVWSWQGRGRAGVKEPGGWRFMTRATRGQTPVDDFNNVSHLYAVRDRLKQVHIENDDALSVIQRTDTPKTLFYVDPPYVRGTRSKRWAGTSYQHEYDDGDHCRLAEALQKVRGKVVLSGYNSELYESLYVGWRKTIYRAKKDSGADADEVLWISPNCGSIGRQMELLAA